MMKSKAILVVCALISKQKQAESIHCFVVLAVCDSACETCIGEGSRGCTKCSSGYKMADNECKGNG